MLSRSEEIALYNLGVEPVSERMIISMVLPVDFKVMIDGNGRQNLNIKKGARVYRDAERFAAVQENGDTFYATNFAVGSYKRNPTEYFTGYVICRIGPFAGWGVVLKEGEGGIKNFSSEVELSDDEMEACLESCLEIIESGLFDLAPLQLMDEKPLTDLKTLSEPTELYRDSVFWRIALKSLVQDEEVKLYITQSIECTENYPDANIKTETKAERSMPMSKSNGTTVEILNGVQIGSDGVIYNQMIDDINIASDGTVNTRVMKNMSIDSSGVVTNRVGDLDISSNGKISSSIFGIGFTIGGKDKKKKGFFG